MQQLPFKTLFLIITMFVGSTCLNINLITTDNVSVSMYTNEQYNSSFVLQTSTFNCSMNQIFTYSQTPQQYVSNAPYTIEFENIGSNISFTLKSYYNNKFIPSLSASDCSNVSSSSCKVTVQNNCPSSMGQFNYFSILELQVSSLSIPLSYYVICDNSFFQNTFEYGLLILMVFCLGLIVLTVIYSKAWSMGGAGIRINYWLVIGFWIVVAIGGILAEVTTNVIGPIIEVGVLLIGVAGLWVCFNQILFLLKFSFLEKGIQVKEIFKIRIIDVISLLMGIAVAIGYYFSNRNWIVNDVICASIMVAAIKIMKYTNLKISLFSLVLGIAVQMAFVEYIHFAKMTSYNDLILNFFNYPFELQLPTINAVYKQKCAWLPFTAVINPGIFMSYLRRFDISRNTNIYFLTSITVFILGSVVWIFISIGSVHSWPFQIVTGPTMIGLVAIFAYKRRQIRTLWEGSFYDEDFANRDGLQQIMDVINDDSSPKKPSENKQDIELIRASVLKDLQINMRKDSDMSILRKISSFTSSKLQSSPSKPPLNE